MGKLDHVSVDVPAEFLACAQSAVAGGEFASIEQVVDTALRAWAAQREADIAKLRMLIEEAEASGPAVPWEGMDILLDQFRAHRAAHGG